MIETPAARVPAEHRLLGLDRRTFPFALVALAVWAFWVALVPWIDDHVAWDDRVEAGDVMLVTPDVTFTPAVGWDVTSGIRVGDDTVVGDQSPPDVVLTDGSVTLVMRAGPWDGTPRELLRQITAITTTSEGGDAFRVTGPAGTVTTGQGHAGAAENFTSPRVTGLLAAFVFGGDGVEVQAVGPPDQLSQREDEITGMIESLTEAGSAS
ncbi:hypothetical protein [Jiangella alba]|uniref:Uncharacterized protein n=1 Tax=Jiangella alba TaxID=561176 RepID=A0A1H5KQV6_9ACTN|nr:hypothetical protein [Jiangella alba]SEE67205.1 hypothetical protein SAMN04488561_2205 [Jiangella alba]